MTTLIPQFDLKNGGATPVGAVNRAINLKLAESVSVKDFGATGDGVTDDTIAIQAAMTSSLTTGKSIYFPAGSYLVTSTIIVTPNIKVYGESCITTVVKTTMDDAIFQLGNDGDYFQHLVLSDLGFQGSGDVTKTNQHAIYANSSPTTGWVAYCVFERLRFSNFGGNTFKFLGQSGGGLINNEFTEIRITGCKSDIMHLEGFTSANTFSHVAFQDSDKSGVIWTNYYAAQNTNFNQCSFESLGGTAGSNPAYGVYADVQTGGGGAQLTFNQCYWEGLGGSTSGAGVYTESPFGLFVNGGVLAALPNSIWVNGSEANVVIDGGYFLASTNALVPTISSFIKFTNSDASSRLNIRSIDYYQSIGGALSTTNYVVFSSWNGQANGLLAGNTSQLTTRTDNLKQTIFVQTPLATGADASIGIAGSGAGVLAIYDRSTGYSALFYFAFSVIGLISDTKVSAGLTSLFSTTKNTASKINVYIESGFVRVQNNTATNPLDYGYTYTQYLV